MSIDIGARLSSLARKLVIVVGVVGARLAVGDDAPADEMGASGSSLFAFFAAFFFGSLGSFCTNPASTINAL